jgi:crotonobetainyl-CoA:carnitine CoA-transferase CaiB-like acyl-CoA transferase
MRVLDTGIWRPVPHATQLLAELGATVLKLEPPGGDPMRVFPEVFAGVAAGKRSVVVDLKTDAGRALALDLARDAHVFTEGWRPGVAARLGVGYDDVSRVNPKVIYASLSGYGQTGPLALVPGHDLNVQAFAGAIAPRDPNDVPMTPVLPVADLAGATTLALEIAAAYVAQQRHGEGARIDVAMAGVVHRWRGPRTGTVVVGGDEPRGSAGYGVFRCADGACITLGVISEDHFWASVCDVLHLDALRSVPYAQRLTRIDELNQTIAAAIATRDSDDLLRALLDAGTPVAPVLTPERASEHFGNGPIDAPVPEIDEHRDAPWG